MEEKPIKKYKNRKEMLKDFPDATHTVIKVAKKFKEPPLEEKIEHLQSEVKALRDKLDWAIGIINVVSNRVDEKGKKGGKGKKRKKGKK